MFKIAMFKIAMFKHDFLKNYLALINYGLIGLSLSNGAMIFGAAADVRTAIQFAEETLMDDTMGRDVSPLDSELFSMITLRKIARSDTPPLLVWEAISAGADVNSLDQHGYTPLERAVQARDIEVVRMLLGRDAAVNFVDERGRTALIEAIDSDREDASAGDHDRARIPDLIAVLLEAGADSVYAANYFTTKDLITARNFDYFDQVEKHNRMQGRKLEAALRGGDQAELARLAPLVRSENRNQAVLAAKELAHLRRLGAAVVTEQLQILERQGAAGLTGLNSAVLAGNLAQVREQLQAGADAFDDFNLNFAEVLPTKEIVKELERARAAVMYQEEIQRALSSDQAIRGCNYPMDYVKVELPAGFAGDRDAEIAARERRRQRLLTAQLAERRIAATNRQSAASKAVASDSDSDSDSEYEYAEPD